MIIAQSSTIAVVGLSSEVELSVVLGGALSAGPALFVFKRPYRWSDGKIDRKHLRQHERPELFDGACEYRTFVRNRFNHLPRPTGNGELGVKNEGFSLKLPSIVLVGGCRDGRWLALFRA